MKTLSNVGARVGLRQRYNAERPHEALGQRLPASLYQPSPRPYPTTLLPITYPGHYEVRRVSRNGGIRWGSRWVNVSHVLAEPDVGFEEIDDGLWEVYFGPVWLGRLQETTCRIVDHLGRAARRDLNCQLTAFITSAPILASSVAVNSFSAKATGHIAPSSRFALSLKPNVAYLVLNFCALWKKQTTLPSLAYAGIPYQSLGERADALALMIAWSCLPMARSGSGISPIFARTACSPSALSARGPRRAAAFSSWMRSFIATRSSSLNPLNFFPIAVVLLADYRDREEVQGIQGRGTSRDEGAHPRAEGGGAPRPPRGQGGRGTRRPREDRRDAGTGTRHGQAAPCNHQSKRVSPLAETLVRNARVC